MQEPVLLKSIQEVWKCQIYLFIYFKYFAACVQIMKNVEQQMAHNIHKVSTLAGQGWSHF